MLQDMDDMEAYYVFYDKVGMSDQHKQCNIGVWNVTKIGIVRLTGKHDLIVCISCM
jgi:hypothetical protein